MEMGEWKKGKGKLKMEISQEESTETRSTEQTPD